MEELREAVSKAGEVVALPVQRSERESKCCSGPVDPPRGNYAGAGPEKAAGRPSACPAQLKRLISIPGVIACTLLDPRPGKLDHFRPLLDFAF